MGVAMTQMIKITTMVSMTTKMLATTELSMNAVERVLEYVDKKDLEPAWEEPQAPKNWPN